MNKRNILKDILTGQDSTANIIRQARRALGITRIATVIDTGLGDTVSIWEEGQPPEVVPRSALNEVCDDFDTVYQMKIQNACPPVLSEDDLPEP